MIALTDSKTNFLLFHVYLFLYMNRVRDLYCSTSHFSLFRSGRFSRGQCSRGV